MKSPRIKDAGIAIRQREIILFYTAGSGNGLEGVGNAVSGDTKNKLTLKQIHDFVVENVLRTSNRVKQCQQL